MNKYSITFDGCNVQASLELALKYDCEFWVSRIYCNNMPLVSFISTDLEAIKKVQLELAEEMFLDLPKQEEIDQDIEIEINRPYGLYN
jgi:hypothetical protein